MDLKETLESCEDIFLQHGTVAIYLYGSYVEGRADKHSDLDIGVLFEEYEGLEQLVDLKTELQNFFEVELDIRPLNVDNLIFKKEVLQNGELVFESDKEKRMEFEHQVMKHYIDMKPYIKRYNRLRSKRLKELKA